MEPYIPFNFCLIPLPDDRLGQKLAMIIECDKSLSFNFDQIYNNIKDLVADYQFPKIIYSKKDLLRNSHGKLLRQKMGVEILQGNSDVQVLLSKK